MRVRFPNAVTHGHRPPPFQHPHHCRQPPNRPPVSQVPLWDRLDPWAGPPVVLVVGDLDAKFVDINTHTLARLVCRRTAAAAAAEALAAPATAAATTQAEVAAAAATAAAAQPAVQSLAFWANPGTAGAGGMAGAAGAAGVGGQGGSGRVMGVHEQLGQLGHALVRVEGAGHAVHVEAPERLLEVLQEAAAALRGGAAAES